MSVAIVRQQSRHRALQSRTVNDVSDVTDLFDWTLHSPPDFPGGYGVLVSTGIPTLVSVSVVKRNLHDGRALHSHLNNLLSVGSLYPMCKCATDQSHGQN